MNHIWRTADEINLGSPFVLAGITQLKAIKSDEAEKNAAIG